MTERKFADLAGPARNAGLPLPAGAMAIADVDVDAAYKMQAALADWFVRDGKGPIAGYKLGATTTAMQTYLHVSSPVYGHILAANVLGHGDTYHRRSDIQTGVECELAVSIGHTMPVRDRAWRMGEVAPFVQWVAPAIEIVENRYGDFANAPLGPMIADDFFQRACVIGAPVRKWQELDLTTITASLIIDGTQIDQGTGRDVLGNPLQSVAVVATLLAARGVPLKKGQIIMTGSMTKTAWIGQSTTTITNRIVRLGECAVHFSAEP